MSLPPQLESDIKELQDRGFKLVAQRDPSNANRIFIEFETYPLPPGWNKSQTRLLLITDISYPNSKLDMFWVEVNVLLNGDKIPQAGEAIETYDGKQWRRFSWHVQKWNPAIDNVSTYLDTVNARLRQLQ
jgi:hypothetical protein